MPALYPLPTAGDGDQALAIRRQAAELARQTEALSETARKLAAQVTELVVERPVVRQQALSIDAAAESLSLSRNGVYHLLTTGQLVSAKVGTRRLIPWRPSTRSWPQRRPRPPTSRPASSSHDRRPSRQAPSLSEGPSHPQEAPGRVLALPRDRWYRAGRQGHPPTCLRQDPGRLPGQGRRSDRREEERRPWHGPDQGDRGGVPDGVDRESPVDAACETDHDHRLPLRPRHRRADPPVSD